MNTSTKITKKISLVGVALLIFSSLPAFATDVEQSAPQAHSVSVSVLKLNFDATNMMVTVSGMLPNLCTAAPRPELQKTADASTLQLVINGEMNGDFCMAVEMVGHEYELAFDIRSLKFNLADLHLNADGKYKIVGPNGKLITELDFGKVAYDLPFASHQIAGGVLAVMNDGRYVAVAQNTMIEVRSPLINLQKYIGQSVDLSGFVVNAHNDDFSVGRSQLERPLFLITGLNTTTH